MNDAARLETLVNTIADIQLPGPPNWQPVFFIMILIALIPVLIGLYRLKNKSREKNSAVADISVLAQLYRLEQDWIADIVTQRSCAYQLATLLRQGLQLSQLDYEPPLRAQQNPQQWQEMLLHLDQCRYPENSPVKLDTYIRTNTSLVNDDPEPYQRQKDPCYRLIYLSGFWPCQYLYCYGATANGRRYLSNMPPYFTLRLRCLPISPINLVSPIFLAR